MSFWQLIDKRLFLGKQLAICSFARDGRYKKIKLLFFFKFSLVLHAFGLIRTSEQVEFSWLDRYTQYTIVIVMGHLKSHFCCLSVHG